MDMASVLSVMLTILPMPRNTSVETMDRGDLVSRVGQRIDDEHRDRSLIRRPQRANEPGDRR
jgi:hypothetical protein